MATVVLPRSLVALFPGAERRVTAEGATLGELIDALDSRWPGLRDRVCDGPLAVRAFINAFVDGQPADLSTAVAPASIVHLIPAVAGG